MERPISIFHRLSRKTLSMIGNVLTDSAISTATTLIRDDGTLSVLFLDGLIRLTTCRCQNTGRLYPQSWDISCRGYSVYGSWGSDLAVRVWLFVYGGSRKEPSHQPFLQSTSARDRSSAELSTAQQGYILLIRYLSLHDWIRQRLDW